MILKYITEYELFNNLIIFLEQPFVYNSAGALFVEGFGAQFVKEVNGSYSAIIGLPMFEVREALEQIGFFDR